jgi:DNA-binding MarR family transcriptional regulator
MEPYISTEQENKATVSHILQLSSEIFRAIRLTIPVEWLTSDMTVAQLRVLLLLQAEGSTRMSSIASIIGTTLPTTTGTVDILVKKGFVVRRDDSEDRRVVICELSPQGQQIMNKMWTLGQQQLQRMLHGLSQEELHKADDVAEILLRNVTSGANPA